LKVLGDAYIKLGMFKTALDVFERLGLWKDVVMCHVTVGNAGMAEEVARNLLRRDDSCPDHWCLLGYATGKMENFEKAWQVSNGRCAEAKRAIGNMLFQRKKYGECLEHYRAAVLLSSTNFQTWLR
jgi:tetratricopeptide (TPR) repeat protein